MTDGEKANALSDYVMRDSSFKRVYEAYEPYMTSIARIQAARPAAHMVVVCEQWCGDCRRLVPRMARILEHLPGWSAELLPWKGKTRQQPYQVKAIPTFIIYPDAQEGRVEIGRIVESTTHPTLEDDLLDIVTG